MHSYQIVAGFSEIKSELRIQFPLSKKLDELQLWFSLKDNVFYAHDYHEHKKCIALATYNKSNNSWQIAFGGRYFGKKLISYAVSSFEISTLVQKFYRLYRLHGYGTFR